MTILLITHDLGVVAEVAQDVIVMYAGRIVEQSDVEAIFHAPTHPYAWGLLGSVSSYGASKRGDLFTISGSPLPLSRCQKAALFIRDVFIHLEVEVDANRKNLY